MKDASIVGRFNSGDNLAQEVVSTLECSRVPSRRNS